MRKTGIISGGRRGIGRAIAVQLARDGFNVVINGTSPLDTGDELSDIRAAGDCLYIQADIAKAVDRQRLVDETVQRFGAIHVLVNNAGVAPLERADLLEMSEESYDRVMNINAKAVMFLTQAVAKQMIKQEVYGKKRGTIINISSCSAAVSSISRGEYCISKASVSMLTMLYAARLARDGILVHEIRPGVISTDMTSGVKDKYDDLIQQGSFPIARWGQPEDVAAAVSVFAGDAFLYTTGNYIDVDGGFHIRRL
ncbi:MAG: 3-ketoacyl-ACP reductase [Treponema sp.]|jgi:NAD(P)-dependent dehydrogenase (short-subunit alcohol dehydrogenase family)|nr:3-ketoacyl-ACP reductase [Treponema sp.]